MRWSSTTASPDAVQKIAQTGQAEQIINKSRFIGVAAACADEREVHRLLYQLIDEHPQANHLAFAYRLQTPQGLVQRFNDAGEPAGTAGKPILQHIEGKDLINACIAVVRYFGGIKLGAGGLARAYGNSAKLALEAARLEAYVEMRQIRLAVDYNRLERLTRELELEGGEILNKDFGERVALLASVPAASAAAFMERYGAA